MDAMTRFRTLIDAAWFNRFKRHARTTRRDTDSEPGPCRSNTEYWAAHAVTNHLVFESREHSLEYLDWRNSQYLFYELLMPLGGHDGETILDYGCGPGHDLVGLAEFSRPKRVIGMDVSPVALKAARDRLVLHGSLPVELIRVQEVSECIPLQDHSIDFIHCSGVLHHMPNIKQILGEFYRVLGPHGTARVMIYNHDSIWNHL